MDGCHDAGAGCDEENWNAVCGRNGNSDARRGRHHPVGFSGQGGRGAIGDHQIRTVNLAHTNHGTGRGDRAVPRAESVRETWKGPPRHLQRLPTLHEVPIPQTILQAGLFPDECADSLVLVRGCFSDRATSPGSLQALRSVGATEQRLPSRGGRIPCAAAVLLTVCLVTPSPAETVPGLVDGLDRNGDGEIVIACLGDSNTMSTWQRNHSGGFPREFGWCEQLPGLLADPRVRIVNLGLGGGTLTRHTLRLPIESGFAADADGQIDIALTSESVDAILLAFGTNDVACLLTTHRRPGWKRQTGRDFPEQLRTCRVAPGARRMYESTPAEVVAAYVRALRRVRSHGPLVLVGRVPPSRRGGRGRWVRPPAAIREINDRLGDLIPSWRLLPFDEVEPSTEFFDSVHLNRRGQTRRAEDAADRLRAAALLATPPAGVRAVDWDAGRWSKPDAAPGRGLQSENSPVEVSVTATPAVGPGRAPRGRDRAGAPPEDWKTSGDAPN